MTQHLEAFKKYSDQQLLSLLREDNENAFAELYYRYSTKIRALAYSKVNSKVITQEIVQEIFSNIWERRHALNINSFSNYLSVAVKYQAINHIKREISHERHNNIYKSFLKISEEDVLESVQFNDLAEAIEAGVQKLPEKTQMVFRLNRLQGTPIPEIALKLNLSEKAIKYHLSKSLKELRFYLKEFLISSVLCCFLS